MNRLFIAIAAVLTVIALVLPTRSQTFTRVTTEGRTMRMLVAGEGPETVVFENGGVTPLETWGKIQPHVSRFARTVTYDRAGNGLSDDGPLPRDGRRIASELRHALDAAGLKPPYVLVGHSLGGLYIRVFAGMFPDAVSGMVLVDPTHEIEGEEQSGVPELDAIAQSVEQARSSRVPPGVPLVLIDAVGVRELPFTTAAIREARRRQRAEVDAESRAYKQWLDAIPGARLVTTDRSGHMVPQEQPDLVIQTIREVVENTRLRQRGSCCAGGRPTYLARGRIS